VALATNALTTLATVKEELGIAVSTWDTMLERYINEASAAVESYVCRKLYWEADIEEKYAGYGIRRMVLQRTPLIGTPVVEYLGTTVSTDDYEVEDANTGVLFALANWIWTTGAVGGITPDPWPGQERKSYTVTYTAGWVTPQQAIDLSVTRTLPYDLEGAVINVVTSKYTTRGKPANVQSERILSWSVTYGSTTDASGWPTEITAILDSYKEACFA
jgi:hypothetical protein